MARITLGEALGKIKKLKNKDTFYEDVKNIIGFYEHIFWEDWNIKTIQRCADACYEKLKF